jgi:hypothetical protein
VAVAPPPEAPAAPVLSLVKSSAAPALSIIVPAAEDLLSLPRCLAAVRAAKDENDELIVVYDTDRAGPASARNRGAAATANSILVFVDADVEVWPDALLHIRRRFAGDPELVAVFGSYDDDPHERDVVSTFRNLLHHYVHQMAAGSVDSFWAGLGAVRRDAFDAVGGFDGRIDRASVEDIELGARLRRVGRIELDPTIQGKHLKRWTLASMLHTDLRLRGVPWARLALRGQATRCRLNLAWRHRVSAVSSLLVLGSLAARRPRAAAAWLMVVYAINERFYRLLARRGRRHWIAGIGLHLMHHVVSVVALVLGTVGPRADGSARRSRGPR